MKAIFYFILLILLSLYLWFLVAFILSGDAAGFVGIAAFALDVFAFVIANNDNNKR